MKNQSIIIFLALGVAKGLEVSAQTPPLKPAAAVVASPTWSVTLTPGFVSYYMFRGVRMSGPSFEPIVETGNGTATLGVWANFPFDDTVPGVSDPEIDLYGSYAFKLTDAVSLLPGFTLYAYPNADKAAGFYRSTFEPNLALNYVVGPLKLTPKVYYDMTLEGPTYEVTATYTFPLKEFRTEISFTGTTGTFLFKDAANNASPGVKNWGDYWLVGVSAPFAVTTESKITVGFAYTEGRNNYVKQGTAPRTVNTGAMGRGVVTVSYTWTF